MNDSLSKLQSDAQKNLRIKLARFESEVNYNIAYGAVSDKLPVVTEDGYAPVVACLAEEPLRLMLARVKAVGGAANIFIEQDDGVCLLVARSVAIKRAGVTDMSNPNSWENGEGSIGLFLEVLDGCNGGEVYLPRKLTKGQRTEISMKQNSLNMELSPKAKRITSQVF